MSCNAMNLCIIVISSITLYHALSFISPILKRSWEVKCSASCQRHHVTGGIDAFYLKMCVRFTKPVCENRIRTHWWVNDKKNMDTRVGERDERQMGTLWMLFDH